MADKPIILTVDDDPEVLQAVTRDVRQGFGEHFRVIRADSGERALDVLRKLKLANESVALMLVDQRMPGLTGVELLVDATRLFPEAKKALLTAYADTEAAITPNIDIRYHSAVAEVCGSERLERVVLADTDSGEREVEVASALFVFIGAAPRTDWLDGRVARDEKGFLLAGPDVLTKGGAKAWSLDRDPYLMETSIPGVFAAGDVRLGSGKRVAMTVGEGATAVMSVWQYRASMGL